MDPNFQAFLIAVMVALPALITALTGAWMVLRKIHDVHTIVNAQRDDMIRQIDVLRKEIAVHEAADKAVRAAHAKEKS